MKRGAFTIFAAIVAMLVAPLSSHAFSFSPERIFVELAPGSEKTITVRVQNETARDARVHVEVKSFIPSGTAGVPAFTDAQLVTSIAPFLILGPTDFVMKADESREYRATMKVPTSAQAGSYFGAIHFSFSADDQGVGTLATTGPLVFLTITGQSEQRISISELPVPNRWTHCIPSQFHLSVRNDGEVFAMPMGNIIVRNMFGNVIRDFSVNHDGAIVLPREERRFVVGDSYTGTSSIMHELTNFGIGSYTIEATLRSQGGSDVGMHGMRFWVFPWRILLLVALVSLMLAVLLGFLFPRRKKV